MKKFSVLTLAVLLGAGVGFAGRSLPVSGKVTVKDSKTMVNVPLMADEVLGKNAQAKAPMKTPVPADAMSGTFIWTNQTLLSFSPSSTLVIEASEIDPTKVEITGWLSGFDFAVEGIVDYEKGTLSIANKQDLGEDEFGHNYFYIKGIDDSYEILDGAADVEATVGVFDGEGFVFETFDIWAIGDPDDEDQGWWILTYSNSIDITIEIDEEQVGQWETVGEATMEDAWIYPSYNLTSGEQVVPSEFPFTVELQKNVDNENLYRVWRPYWNEEALLYPANSSVYNGQIVFDITDPDHVIVKAGYYAGFANNSGEFCNYGLLGWQIYGYGDMWDDSMLPELIEWMESKGQTFDTFKDNTLYVNKSVFDTNIACENAYSWKNNEYIVTKITFPAGDPSAVSGIDSENAPVKYYNLQGVEVANPEAGQLVICRQGDKATKKIIK